MFNIYRNIFILIFCFISYGTFSQVEEVNYFIKYNESSCLWDVGLVVTKGKATKVIERAQFNSQVSIVVPTGSNFSIEKLRMPLQSNQSYNGTKPLTWFVNNFVSSPPAQPESDFIGIAPILNPTAFYNNMNTGDTIVLFSAKIEGSNTCGRGVRMFRNNIDPDSAADGMNGGDFSNGFTLGSLDQKYRGNIPTKTPLKPSVKNIVSDCSTGLSIKFDSEMLSCHGDNVYSWTGPNNFTATSKFVNIPNATSQNDGEYKLIINDDFGCTDTIKVYANSAPNAGQDGYVKCITNGITVLSSQSEGQWQLIANQSAGTVMISSPNGFHTEVSNFSSTGLYVFARVGAKCSDYVNIFVDNECDCSFGKSISINGPTEFCGATSDIQMLGDAIPSEKYQWIYKFNEKPYKPAPGLNIFKNFKTQELVEGQHLFRRINYNQDQTCADTSQAIVIFVKPEISAMGNSVVQCYEEGQAQISATGVGQWIVGGQSAGTLSILDYFSRNTTVYNFSTAGKYYLIWTNNVCSDTVIVDAKPLCGCSVAEIAPTKNICKGEKVILEGSCDNGYWLFYPSNTKGVKIDSISAGNAHLQIDWDSLPTSFRAVFRIDLQNTILTDTMVITKRVTPTIYTGWDFDYCRGSGNTIITATGVDNDYQWSTGATARYILVSPEITSTYIVKGTNSFGCAAFDTINVFVHEKPKGQIPVTINLKVGESLKLKAGFWTDAVQHIWTGPNNLVSYKQNTTIDQTNISHAGVYTLTVISEYDCYAFATVNVVIQPTTFKTNSLDKNAMDKTELVENRTNSHTDFKIFPNPASDLVNIECSFSEQSDVKISNQMGHIVKSIHVTEKSNFVQFDMHDLPSGIYYVTWTSKNVTRTSKLIVVR